MIFSTVQVIVGIVYIIEGQFELIHRLVVWILEFLQCLIFLYDFVYHFFAL